MEAAGGGSDNAAAAVTDLLRRHRNARRWRWSGRHGAHVLFHSAKDVYVVEKKGCSWMRTTEEAAARSRARLLSREDEVSSSDPPRCTAIRKDQQRQSGRGRGLTPRPRPPPLLPGDASVADERAQRQRYTGHPHAHTHNTQRDRGVGREECVRACPQQYDGRWSSGRHHPSPSRKHPLAPVCMPLRICGWVRHWRSFHGCGVGVGGGGGLGSH